MTDPAPQQPYGAQPGSAPPPVGIPISPAPVPDDGGYAAQYAGTAVVTPTTTRMGWAAVAVGLVAFVGPIVNAVVAWAVFDPATTPPGSEPTIAGMSFALTHALWVWFVLGLWAIIHGGVALALKRGVGHGVIAIGLGLVGPWIGLVGAGLLFTYA